MHARVQGGQQLELADVTQRSPRGIQLDRRSQANNCCEASDIGERYAVADAALDSADLALRPAETISDLLHRPAGAVPREADLAADIRVEPRSEAVGIAKDVSPRWHGPREDAAWPLTACLRVAYRGWVAVLCERDGRRISR